jgi:hypothetical protein
MGRKRRANANLEERRPTVDIRLTDKMHYPPIRLRAQAKLNSHYSITTKDPIMPLWNRSKLDVTSNHEFARGYRDRPIVPPAAIAPVIGNALDLAFIFLSLGAQIAVTAGNNLTQAAARFDEEHAQLLEACRALMVVRIADEFPLLLGVHITIEGFVGWLTQYYRQDALLTMALFTGDKRKAKRLQELASKYEEAVEKAKQHVRSAVRALHDEALVQYVDLGLSSNNLIDLGLEDLVEE